MNVISAYEFAIVISLALSLSVIDASDNETGIPDELFGNGNDKHTAMLFQLSINQSEEGLSKLLIKIDTNNDGMVTQEELTEWILKSNEAIEEKEAKEYINQFDNDNDSSVSWEEYFQHFYGSQTLDLAEANSDHKEILDFVESDKFRFQSADKNKDGTLSMDELKAFLHSHNHLEMLDYEAQKTLKDYDKNNDSKIGKEEFGHVQYGGITINPLQKTRINRIFESYDLDKDDNLSLEEIKMWLKPDVSEYARTEASYLMKVSDVNKDSIVTKEEILTSLEYWINSKATNYGDHVRDEL